MSLLHRPVVCDRVRAQVSLGLDGELSQLESRMVANHLARCAECAGFEADVLRITHELRSAPLEPLQHPLSLAGVVRRRSRISVSRVQVGVAAAVAVAMLGALTQITAGESKPAFATPARFDTSTRLAREVDQIIADGRAFSRRGGEMAI
jgi:anti-sigma factor RsiW